MGGPMAINLARAGYEVTGYDVDARRFDGLHGVTRAGSVAEVVDASDGVVISIVRTLAQTQAVSAEVHQRGALLVIMSTIDPTSMQGLSALLAERGVEVVDAPVSGGVTGAVEATLAIMFAGSPAAKARVRPLFEAMGSNIFDMGDRAGLGQAVKLAHQVMMAANIHGVVEGMKLATHYGLEEGRVGEVVATGVGASFVVENWERIKRDYTEGNAYEIVYKDLRSIMNAAAEERIPLPITALGFNRMGDIWGK